MGFVANFIAFQQCKSFENRLRFDKFRDCLKVGSFLRHIVVHPIWHTVLPPAVLLCSISTARHVRGCHGPATPPPKKFPFTIPLHVWGSGPHIDLIGPMWFLGPTRVHIPNNILISLAVFAGPTIVTADRQTD